MKDPTIAPPQIVKPIPNTAPQANAISVSVNCPNCRMETAVPDVQGPIKFKCQFCKSAVTAQIFPRLTKEPKVTVTGEIAGDGDATCQFYPDLKAEVVCDECGSFMSEKATITWGERILCMPCLHNLREKKGDLEFRPNLKIWDNRALGLLALLPLTLFTAPLALFLLIRYRHEPSGWVPRSRFRWFLALALTILILIGWTALVIVWIAMLTRDIT